MTRFWVWGLVAALLAGWCLGCAVAERDYLDLAGAVGWCVVLGLHVLQGPRGRLRS